MRLLRVSTEVLQTHGHLTEAVTVLAAMSASQTDQAGVLHQNSDLLERLRAGLGEQAFDTAWTRGRSWPLADAADLTALTLGGLGA